MRGRAVRRLRVRRFRRARFRLRASGRMPRPMAENRARLRPVGDRRSAVRPHRHALDRRRQRLFRHYRRTLVGTRAELACRTRPDRLCRAPDDGAVRPRAARQRRQFDLHRRHPRQREARVLCGRCRRHGAQLARSGDRTRQRCAGQRRRPGHAGRDAEQDADAADQHRGRLARRRRPGAGFGRILVELPARRGRRDHGRLPRQRLFARPKSRSTARLRASHRSTRGSTPVRSSRWCGSRFRACRRSISSHTAST